MTMRDQESPLTPTLDRVWAATRPADLTGDEFDRIWAEVSRARDRDQGRPTLLPFAPRRRALVIAALGLAQVAAVAAFALFMLKPNPDPAPLTPGLVTQAALTTALTTLHDVKVETDEVLMVMIAVEGQVDYRRTQVDAVADSGTNLALLDVPSVNPNDQLNQWEALAQ